MADFIVEIFGFVIIAGIILFIFGFVVGLISEFKDEIKSVANLAKDGAKKSLDYTNQNTSKVRDYAIIVVCIAVIIALIAFFVR